MQGNFLMHRGGKPIRAPLAEPGRGHIVSLPLGVGICLALAGFGGAVSACTVVPAYEREVLAHPAMQHPVWPHLQSANKHMFEVREGSRGATGKSGGGCGCN